MLCYVMYAGLRSAAPQALSTTSSPPLLLAPQARWRQHAVLALPEGHWATARASTARSEVNYFASISGKLVELDAFGVPSSPRTRSAAHSAPILRTPLAGAAPSRRSVPKLVDEVRRGTRTLRARACGMCGRTRCFARTKDVDLQCVGSRRWGSTSAGASVSARSFRVSLSCPSHQREDQLATL